jgi:thiol-disulfide isomerase/thioredoxin
MARMPVQPRLDGFTSASPCTEPHPGALIRVALLSVSCDKGVPGCEEWAVATRKLPRLVDSGANRCIPCKAMAPILDELKAEYAGRMEVQSIDEPALGSPDE